MPDLLNIKVTLNTPYQGYKNGVVIGYEPNQYHIRLSPTISIWLYANEFFITKAQSS